MRDLILRILLLVVFFNTAIGTPVHLAGHLHGPAGHAHAASTHGHGHGQGCNHDTALHDLRDAHDRHDLHAHAGGAAGDEGGHPGEHAQAHGQCTWCPNHAQLASALAPSPASAVHAPDATAAFNAGTPAAFLPQPERWRYAARDPPSMS